MRRALFATVAAFVLFATAFAIVSYDAIAPEAPPGQDPTETPTPTPVPTPTVTPSPFEPYRFAAIGDFGTGDATQLAVARRMCNWWKKHPFDRVFTSGDNIYPDGSPEYFYDHFRVPYRCLRRKDVRFHVSLGNHDYMTDQGRPQIEKDLFGMKGRNYVVRRGGVRFVLWDTNTMDREWLKGALRTKAGDDWTVVLFHYPVYSPGGVRGSFPGLADSVAGLFRRRGVDLVINGHDHIYAVTKPLRKIRYAVTGGGGAPLYTCGDASFKDRCEERHHFLYVVVHRNYIHVQAIPIEGAPFDKFRAYGRD